MIPLARISVDQREAGVVVARVDGEIDMGNTPELYQALAAALSNADVGLVVDLSAVSYLDSAGVRLLFELEKQLKRHQQQLRIVVPEEALIRRLLQIVNMNAHVGMHGTLAEALAASRDAGIIDTSGTAHPSGATS